MGFETIQFQSEGAVAWITLDRPDKLNAICRPLLSELAQALDRVAQDKALRAVVLTGTGRAFCAGQDLGEPVMASADPAAAVAESLEKFYHPVLRRLHDLPLPVVAAVNGIAAGAGANLALNCDLVVAGESASFIQAFTRIGLVPDCGGTWLLPRLVGAARARALALLAEPLTAAQAENWGLIYRAVPDDALAAEARALAGRLAAGPTAAYGMIKQALDASAGNDLASQLALEGQLQERAARGADFREGVAAFLEKRPARFTGG